MKKKLMKLVLVVTLMILPLVSTQVNVKAANKSVLIVSTVMSDSPTTRVFNVYNSSSEDMSYDYYITGDVQKEGKGTIKAGETKKHEITTSNGSVTFQLVDNYGNLSSGIKSLSAYNVKVYYRYNGTDIKNMTRASCSSSKPASITAPKQFHIREEFIIVVMEIIKKQVMEQKQLSLNMLYKNVQTINLKLLS